MPEPDRQPPHNLEAEEAVLGAVLASGRLLVEVAAVLEEADFYRPAHRAIWRAMLRLADRGQPTDPVTVLGELDDSGELADVGGGPFLHTLVEAVPTVANAGHYAHLVADTARRRRVIDLGIRWPTPTPTRPCWPTWPASWPTAPPPRTVGTAGSRRSRSGVGERCPRSRSRSCPAGWASTWPRSPPPPRPRRTWPACSPWPCWPPSPPARSRSSRGPGWREPLCLFVAVGMDAGTRKSTVFTALTRPVADFERDQAAAALPGITETAILRRIADQAAATAEAAAGKAPASQQEEARAEAIARAAEAVRLVVPPLPRWLVDDATPEALAGLLATYGRIALLSARRGRVRPDGRPLQPEPPGPTSGSTSRATPAICSRSTAAADPPSTWSGPA